MTKVLVIDEDAAIAQEVLQSTLMAAGYEVCMAEDAASGLELVNEFRPDIVILDPWIPLGLGFILAHSLRELAPELPVIFVTAGKEGWVSEMAADMGAVAVLEKPYDPDLLLTTLKEAVDHRTELTSAELDESADMAASVTIVVPTTPESGPAPQIHGRHRILVVEDDRKIAMALAIRLKDAGQEIVLAYDALTGLASAVEYQPDLVILDIGLPGGSGLVVAERIQALATKPTPVIFLTASRQPGLRRKAEAIGAAAFLEKPYEARELISTVARVLQPAGGAQIAATAS